MIGYEIQYLENYIALQQIRLDERCKIKFQHNVANEHARIAPMILIVFLENAFKHGVSTMAEKAYINLSIESLQNRFCFEIENNFNQIATTENGGLGLKNIERRLSIIYNEDYLLKSSNHKNQFNIKLQIPLK